MVYLTVAKKKLNLQRFNVIFQCVLFLFWLMWDECAHMYRCVCVRVGWSCNLFGDPVTDYLHLRDGKKSCCVVTFAPDVHSRRETLQSSLHTGWAADASLRVSVCVCMQIGISCYKMWWSCMRKPVRGETHWRARSKNPNMLLVSLTNDKQSNRYLLPERKQIRRPVNQWHFLSAKKRICQTTCVSLVPHSI